MPPHFLAPRNEMLVTFVTDGTLQRPSFSMDYAGSELFATKFRTFLSFGPAY